MNPLYHCAVCPEPGTQQCSRCRSTFFCSAEHQALIWSTHKVLCKRNSPLVFTQLPLSPAELENFVLGYNNNSANFATVVQKLALVRHDTSSPEADHIPVNDMLSIMEPGNMERQYNRRLSLTPAQGRSDIVGGIRKWLAQNGADAAGIGPFARVATVLIANEMSIMSAAPLSRLVHLDAATRNAIELQALIACTLLSQSASYELVELGLERLLQLAGDDAAARGVWADLTQHVADTRASRQEDWD